MTTKLLLLPALAVLLAACSSTQMTSTTTPTPEVMVQESEVSEDTMAEGDLTANSEGVMVGGAMMTPDKTIGANAMNSGDHTTLLAAVDAAGLRATLDSAGPFTVFAPTNAAFDKLPAGTVSELMKPANKTKLNGILTYHVVPGYYRAADLTDGMKLKTVQGEELTFTMENGAWMVDGAAITTADVISRNGVTHVIDTVLMPPGM